MNIISGGMPRPNTVYSLNRVTKSGWLKPHSMLGHGASPKIGATITASRMIGKMPSLAKFHQKRLRFFSSWKWMENTR